MTEKIRMRQSSIALKVIIVLIAVLASASVVESSVTGTQRVLVIPVEFNDVEHKKTVPELQSWMENNVRDYFSEVSLNQLELDIVMVDAWVPLEQPREHY